MSKRNGGKRRKHAAKLEHGERPRTLREEAQALRIRETYRSYLRQVAQCEKDGTKPPVFRTADGRVP